jgi:hypothetical protein
MNRPFVPVNIKKILIPLLAAAVLLPMASANAWWRGYDSDWRCDPKLAYYEEYGFLKFRGPSQGDIRRLYRDQWKAAYYGDARYDPVRKALRKQCPQRYSGRYGW